MDRWKELKECVNFNTLREICTDDDLDFLEEELEDFLSNKDKDIHEDDYPPVACWYNGVWSTDDLVNFYQTN